MAIDSDTLIARQARELADLYEQVADYEARMKRIHMEMIGIGGPLNDNVLQYSKEQLRPFARILDAVMYPSPPVGGGE